MTLLMCAGETIPEVFFGAVKTYRLAAKYPEIKDLGQVLPTDANENGTICDTDALTRAEQLSAKL